ncbi:MAG: DtxR family transcriptional regulator, manganese transport regulator [Candidatus Sumerlaeota bacterium]|nr:DtxR family transcriptional regulator, manganese transport regulator [Candidatus Sumerlaeota bacterium]
MTPARKAPPTASRQRSDHAQENAEDYVELISDLQREIGAAHKSDIASRLGVSHVTVHKTIKRLTALGLVHAQSYRAVSLTPEGEKLAQDARERHQLLIRFLEHLGVSQAVAEMDAEGLEHHCSPETLERIVCFCLEMERQGAYERSASQLKPKRGGKAGGDV